MYQYKIKKLNKIVDGDTFDCDIDLGFDVMLSNQRIRLSGIDTWESRTRNLKEKEKGLAAKAYTKDVLESSNEITIKSFGKGKYGRMLGEVYCDGACLNEQLIDAGHAHKYDGGKKKKFNE